MEVVGADSGEKSPRVCVLTPAGRGAIAVVGVFGAGSVHAVDRCFHAASGKPLESLALGRIAFGRWGHVAGEEVVVTRRPRCIEVHCHGGAAASRAVVESLEHTGCVAVDQPAWLAATGGTAIEAAAHLALGKAVTEQAALILLDQLHGAFRQAVGQIVALLEAGRIDEAAVAVQALLDRQPVGERLTTPARVVLTGAPNVGKSSLINALVGYERSIVFDTPGTTRDVVTATTAIDGWAIELVDTAGLRVADGDIERAGIALAQQVIADADVVVRVGEAASWFAAERAATLLDAWLADQPLVEVANKVDQLSAEQRENLHRRAGDAVVLTSATEGTGIDKLLSAIGQVVTPAQLEPGAAVPFACSHFARLTDARAQLTAGDGGAAQQALLAMLAH